LLVVAKYSKIIRVKSSDHAEFPFGIVLLKLIVSMCPGWTRHVSDRLFSRENTSENLMEVLIQVFKSTDKIKLRWRNKQAINLRRPMGIVIETAIIEIVTEISK
jgi:hypothetical protein